MIRMRKALLGGVALVCLAGCHRRAVVTETDDLTPRDPVCLDATERVVRYEVDAGVLLIDLEERSIGCSSPERTERHHVATFDLLAATPDCPAGQPVYEAGGLMERELDPRFIASLDRRERAELGRALQEFARNPAHGLSMAFVLACTTTGPRFVFVEMTPGHSGDPKLARFEFPPQPPPELPPGSSAVREPPAAPTPYITGTCNEALTGGDTRWMGRQISTGIMPGPSRQTFWVLSQTKGRARFVAHELQASKPRPLPERLPAGDWRCVESLELEGTVKLAHGEFVFSLSQGGDTPVSTIRCRSRLLPLAQETATRVPTPSTMEGCKASLWKPRVTSRRKAFECTGAVYSMETPFFLREPPGVEHVTVDEDDCGDPALALRQMPSDGGLAPVMTVPSRWR